MAVRFAGTALDGQTVTMAVNGGTALTQAAWGGGGDGGTISIDVERSELQIAPDSVGLTVDFSSATFDATGPSGGEVYDDRLHDLIFLWDLDDPGNWSAPVNVLTEWKARTTAIGPDVRHMYTTPGTYNPSVMVIEPSSGKTATATLTGGDAVVIGDPDTVFSGTDTICYSATGGFVGAPSGARQVTLTADGNGDYYIDKDETNWDTYVAGTGTPKRILFEGGQSFLSKIKMDAATPVGMMIGSYGTGKAEINTIDFADSAENAGNFFKDSGFFIQSYGITDSATVAAEIRFVGLSFKGTFDSTTDPANQAPESGVCANAITARSGARLILSECDFDGFPVGSVQYEFGANITYPAHLHMDDCTLTNFGGQYPIFVARSTHADSSCTFTGCRFAQTAGAIADNNVSNNNLSGSRAAARIEHMTHNHVRGCDMFITDCSQPVLKLLTIPYADGATVNVHSSAFEGGVLALDIGGTTTESGKGLERTNIQNAIVDGIVYVASYNGQRVLNSYCTGVTLRNSLGIWPDVPRVTSGTTAVLACRGFVRFQDWDQGAGTPTATHRGQPIRVYSNTMLFERQAAQNGSWVPNFTYDVAAELTDYEHQNNVVQMPNLGGSSVTTWAPLTSTALWTPRNIGRRNPDTLVLDTSYATPAGAVKESAPDTGSSALDGATTGNRGFLDVTGSSRYGAGVYDEGTVDAGAWQT
jgi:hypothetical protein